MTDKKLDHGAISLGAGSYDAEKLQAVGDAAAAAASPEERKEILEKGLKEASTTVYDPDSIHHQPGYKWKTVTRTLAEGVEVKERISVYDPEKAVKDGLIDASELPVEKKAASKTPAASDGKPAEGTGEGSK